MDVTAGARPFTLPGGVGVRERQEIRLQPVSLTSGPMCSVEEAGHRSRFAVHGSPFTVFR